MFKIKMLLKKQLFNSNSIFWLNSHKQQIQCFNKQIYQKILYKTIPNFLDIQRISFKKFLKFGIFKELKIFQNNSNLNKTIAIIFYTKKYKLLPPKLTIKQALLKRQTYASQLIIPVKIIDLNENILFFKWILISHLPLMTQNGHFIFNGSPRIILNQIIRSPGIYFQKNLNQNKLIYSVDFIAQRGTWLRLEIDNKKGDIWVKMKKIPKLPIFIFFRCFGLSLPILNNYINKHNFEKYLNNFQNYAYLYNELNYKFQENNFAFEKLGKKFIYKKFLNTRTYNLSQLGRLKINQTLGINIPWNYTNLTAKDILFACFYLIECFQGLQQTTDIDALENRKIKSSGELIQMQFMIGLLKFRKLVYEKFLLEESLLLKPDIQIKKKKFFINQQFTSLLKFKTINNTLREFFGTNPLSQLLDQTNPLSEITHKRRLSSLGFGGINRENAGMAIRGIHSTHYGRICPIETPEGQNAGLVNSFTIYAQLNTNGFIETPFYKIYKGYILKNQNIYKFTSNQEKDFNIAPSDIKKTCLNFLLSGLLIPIRKLKKFQYISRNNINFLVISPLQMISIATSLIPFIEHNDGNRALMGSNMQRQAIATIKPNLPIIGTGLESKIMADITYNLQAQNSGFVSYVDGKKLIIYFLNKQSIINKKQITNTKIFLKQNNLTIKTFSLNFNYQILFKKQIDSLKFVFYNFNTCTNYLKKEKNKFFLKIFKIYFWPQFKNINLKRFGYFSFFFKKELLNFKEQKSTLFLSLLVKLNTNKLLTLFTLGFENIFYHFLEILNNYSQLFIYNLNDKNLKSFLTKRFIFLIKNISNKIILINYSQKLLLKGLLLIIKNIDFKNNVYFKNKLNGYVFNTVFLSRTIDFILIKKKKFVRKLIDLYFFQNTINYNSKYFKQNKKNLSLILNRFKINKLNILTHLSLYYFSFYYFQKQKICLIKDKNFLFQRSDFLEKNQYFIFFKITNNALFSKINLLLKLNLKKTLALSKKFYFKYFIFIQLYLKKKFNFKKLKCLQFKTKIQNIIFKTKLITKKINSWFIKQYELNSFYRSNQDTYLRHCPSIQENNWIEKGDLLADNSTSFNGQLAIGQNILVGYMPWEGYNFEDAVLLNETIVSNDFFTSLHIERYDIEIRDTSFGLEKLTKLQDFQHLSYLDHNGIAKIGTWVETGDILVSKIAPLKNKVLSSYEKLLYAITDKELPKNKNTSFRVPLGIKGRIINIEIVYRKEKIKKNKFKNKINFNKFLLFLQSKFIFTKNKKAIIPFYFYGFKFYFNIYFLLRQKFKFSFYFLTLLKLNCLKVKLNNSFILTTILLNKINRIFKNKKFLLNKINTNQKLRFILTSKNVNIKLKKFKKWNLKKQKFTFLKFNNEKINFQTKTYSIDYNNLKYLKQNIFKIYIYIAEKKKFK